MTKNLLAAIAALLPSLPSTASGTPLPPASLRRRFSLPLQLRLRTGSTGIYPLAGTTSCGSARPHCEASGYIFGEFDRLDVLQIQLLIRDSSYQSRKRLSPDPVVRAKSEAGASRSCGSLTRRCFAMTPASGLPADYQALIEKRNMPSLRNANKA